MKPYITASKYRKIQRDEEQFYLMHYMAKAMVFAIDHAFNGRNAKSELLKEPLFSHLLEQDHLNEMTEEERYNFEVKKAIANEEAWITASRLKGLPETIV